MLGITWKTEPRRIPEEDWQKGLDDICARFNGIELRVWVSESRTHGRHAVWSVKRPRDVLRALGVVRVDKDEETRSWKDARFAYELAKNRAENFSKLY